MSGYLYGESAPTEECPYCGATCHADFVDIGVGYTQCGPYHCEKCGASEIGPNDDERDLSEKEKSTGWYAPGSEPGSSANVVDGRIVRHDEALRVYKQTYPLMTSPDGRAVVEGREKYAQRFTKGEI